MIQELNFLLRKLFRHFLTPKNWGSSEPTVVYALCRWPTAIFSLYFCALHYGWCHIVVAVNSSMLVNAQSCMNVFRTSESKYCRRQSLWDEWRRVSHCPPIGGLSRLCGGSPRRGASPKNVKNAVRDLNHDLENEVKVQRSRNFDWPIGISHAFFPHNQRI